MQKYIYIIIFIIIILMLQSNSNLYDYKYKDELFIYNNFFEPEQFITLKKLLKYIKFKDDNRLSTRKTNCLFYNNNKQLYQMIYNHPKIKQIATEILRDNYKKNPSFPIEYRIYPEKSLGMDWHKDTSLFNPDCLEVVFTTENNSDMKFQWNENGRIKSINPKPNTMVIVRPNSVLHSVSSANVGTRKILKFIIQAVKSNPTDLYFKEIKNCPK